MRHHILFSSVILFLFTGVIFAQPVHRAPHFLFNDSLWKSLPENIRERWQNARISREADFPDKQPEMLREHFPPWKRHPRPYETDEEKYFLDSKLNKNEDSRHISSLPTKPKHEPYQTQQMQTPSDSIEIDWIANYPSGLISSYDYACAAAIDSAGNIYVTGTSGSDYFSDYLTIKYNSSGEEQWVARYNGPGDDDDEATALAVDGSGNVFVTGWSYGSGTSYDYATIKYNSSGIQQWVARYNGPGNDDDEATALTVDGSGNVFVTGWSYGSGTSYDYATIKYNESGVEQWVARYNGPGNFRDQANALAVDGYGNVYVTGYSYGSSTDYDYATIKYNSSGIQQWVARYNGPVNSDDHATAIAIDGSSNVYVTGTSYGSGTDYDYATIKYNSTGEEQWVERYNGPGNSGDGATAITVDGSGNVYVTGTSYGSGTDYDYATIKYNSTGIQQWVARYNGPGNSDDETTALNVDGSGNVYVTGHSYGSGKSYDYATIKYNESGEEQWVARYKGPGNSDDFATALAVDAFGNVYVTGNSYGSGTGYDYATIKYNSTGEEQWVARYSGPLGYFDDEAKAIALDGSGNVYVTGYSFGSGTYYDYATVQYNSSGQEQWVARYSGPGNFWDQANALAVDGSGNVYVTG